MNVIAARIATELSDARTCLSDVSGILLPRLFSSLHDSLSILDTPLFNAADTRALPDAAAGVGGASHDATGSTTTAARHYPAANVGGHQQLQKAPYASCLGDEECLSNASGPGEFVDLFSELA